MNNKGTNTNVQQVQTGPKAKAKRYTVFCDYCGKEAKLVQGSAIYETSRKEEYLQKWFWVCWDCDAWVGTHSNSHEHKALGRLSDKELRAAKVLAHYCFDPYWQEISQEYPNIPRNKIRRAAYRWLGEQLNINTKEAHIGNFDEATCMRVVSLCEQETTESKLVQYLKDAVNQYYKHNYG